jgi:CRISP-associated protein Cas1
MHTLAISEQGTSVHAEGDNLLVQRGKSVLRRIRAGELEQVLLFGGVEVTRQAMNVLLRREIEMVLLTQNGKFRGRLSGRGSKNVQLRLAQYQRTTDPAFCLAVARTIVTGKLQNQRQILLRAQRRLQDDDLAAAIGNLRVQAQRAAECTDLEVLRGFEGQGAALYFGQFGKLIRIPEFQFTTRSRRPPRDPVNALLSFGYAVLGSLAESDVYSCGLDPMLGFLHQPAYGRPSLMLDLLEEFRPLIDSLVLRVVNRRQLSVQDFDQRTGQSLAEMLADESPPSEPAGPVILLLDDPPAAEPLSDGSSSDSTSVGDRPEPAVAARIGQEPDAIRTEPVVGVYLNDTGRKIFLNELFRRMRDRLYYPPRDAQLELRDILQQQIYQLARVIEGQQERYQPYVAG